MKIDTEKAMTWLAFGVVIARLEEKAVSFDVTYWLRSKSEDRGSFIWCANVLGWETKKLKRIFYQRPEKLAEKLDKFRKESFDLAEDYDKDYEEKETETNA